MRLSGGAAWRTGSMRLRTGLAALLLAAAVTGCGRTNASDLSPTPTRIPQPTPDPTMVEIIKGNGSPVAYLPPLEIRGSPTAAPAASKPSTSSGGARAAPKPAPVREPAPAPKPAPVREPAPAPAPKPAIKPAQNPSNSGSGSSGAPPAVINPSNILPGSSVRPNATPSR